MQSYIVTKPQAVITRSSEHKEAMLVIPEKGEESQNRKRSSQGRVKKIETLVAIYNRHKTASGHHKVEDLL